MDGVLLKPTRICSPGICTGVCLEWLRRVMLEGQQELLPTSAGVGYGPDPDGLRVFDLGRQDLATPRPPLVP
jgi:hypothetical protein